MNNKEGNKEYLEDFELDPRILKQKSESKIQLIKKLREKKEDDEDVVGPSLRKIPKCISLFFSPQ